MTIVTAARAKLPSFAARNGIPEDIWSIAEAAFHAPKVPGGIFDENYVRPIALAILAERTARLSEIEELRYLQSEVEQGDRIIRQQERERCARIAERDGNSHAATTVEQTAEWHSRVSAEVRAADRIAASIRGLSDEQT